MLTPTHLLVTVLIVMLLRLNRDEVFIALMFGVVIDIDHIFALPRYVEDNGWAAVLRQSWDDGTGLPWRSWLHHPMTAIVVGHLSEGWRYLLPLPFWAVHLGMDWLQLAVSDYNTAVESAILVLSATGITYVKYSDWARHTGHTGAGPFLEHMIASTRNRRAFGR